MCMKEASWWGMIQELCDVLLWDLRLEEGTHKRSSTHVVTKVSILGQKPIYMEVVIRQLPMNEAMNFKFCLLLLGDFLVVRLFCGLRFHCWMTHRRIFMLRSSVVQLFVGKIGWYLILTFVVDYFFGKYQFFVNVDFLQPCISCLLLGAVETIAHG